jgi:hypothetical protein
MIFVVSNWEFLFVDLIFESKQRAQIFKINKIQLLEQVFQLLNPSKSLSAIHETCSKLGLLFTGRGIL